MTVFYSILIILSPLFLYIIFGIYITLKIKHSIQGKICPNCKEKWTQVKDVQSCGVRLRITPGTKVEWDRLPQHSYTCPKCNEKFCIDRQSRFTSCNHSDYIHYQKKENSEQES